jgi:benzoyl-CoA reductase subunit C
MDRFQKILGNHHKYAQEWKEKTGGKVLGYLASYFTEELVYAAGVLPVRILSGRDNDGISQRYLYGQYCPTSLGLLAQGLKGNYDYLDGIGHAECCMCNRGCFSSWRLHVPAGRRYSHYVSMPSYVDQPGVNLLVRAELSAFKEELEEWTGTPVTDKAIDHAIEVYNTNRALMRQIYELRRSDNPPVSGTEAMAMTLSSQIMDKEEHNELLKDVLQKLGGYKGGNNTGPRLMFTGSEISDTGLIRLIESAGATVVIDWLCNGMSYIWNQIIPREDRLMAVAQYYLDKPRCPMKDVTLRRRPVEYAKLSKDYSVDGVIYATQKFSYPHHYDRHPVEELMKERMLPVHNLEYTDTVPAIELRDRMEAFIGTLRK